MNSRFKKIRELNGLSQNEFAEKLGLQRNSISLIENGKRNLSDRTIKDICRIFKINENWLKTGYGKIEADEDFNIIDKLANEFNLDDKDIEIIRTYATLPPYFRKHVREYVLRMIVPTENDLKLEEENRKLEEKEKHLRVKQKEKSKAIQSIKNTEIATHLSDMTEESVKRVSKNINKT